MKVSSLLPPRDAVAVRAFWEAHRAEVAEAVSLGSATVRTITLPATQKQAAEKVYADLLAGADLAVLARDQSIDSFANGGGLRGEITRYGGELREDLAAAAFSLQAGEIKLVEDQAFYCILKLDSHHPGKPRAADDFDAPGVSQATEALLAEQQHNEWGKNYLRQL